MQDSIITINARKMLIITAGAFCLSAAAGMQATQSETKRADEGRGASRSVESVNRVATGTLTAELRRG